MSIFSYPSSNFCKYKTPTNPRNFFSFVFFILPLLPPFPWQNRIKAEEKVCGKIKNTLTKYFHLCLLKLEVTRAVFYCFSEMVFNFCLACILLSNEKK